MYTMHFAVTLFFWIVSAALPVLPVLLADNLDRAGGGRGVGDKCEAQSRLNIFCKALKIGFALLSDEIRCSDAGSFISKLALRYPLGTIVNPLSLISPSRLCDTHGAIIPFCGAEEPTFAHI